MIAIFLVGIGLVLALLGMYEYSVFAIVMALIVMTFDMVKSVRKTRRDS
jgi:hypothetical protein